MRSSREKGAENVAFILVTITCNSAGGQPVSMANVREVHACAKKHGVRMFFDSARFAENAYFVQQREEEFANTPVREIVREMFFLRRGLDRQRQEGTPWSTSAAWLCFKEDEELFKACQAMTVPMEGFPTYGGLAGRDMECLARGLYEGTEEDYLAYRINQVKYLGDRLLEGGVPIQYPTGGHAGIRGCKTSAAAHSLVRSSRPMPWPTNCTSKGACVPWEIGSMLLGRDPATGEQQESHMELLRLTIPRRVYTNNHMDVIADALIAIKERAHTITGLTFTYEPKITAALYGSPGAHRQLDAAFQGQGRNWPCPFL